MNKSTLPNRLFQTLLLLVTFSTALNAQRFEPGSASHYASIRECAMQHEYGNNLLMVGVYFDNPYIGARGNPYLMDEEFIPGTIEYRGKTYQNVLMKYDLVDQRLIVDHNIRDYLLITVITDEFLTAFSFNDMDFRRMAPGNADSTFYQVVAEYDRLQCYYQWYKVRSISHHLEHVSSFVFSDSKKHMYLVIDDHLIKFRNNRTFLKCFPEAVQPALKQKLKSAKLKIQHANDKTVRELLDAANRYLEEENE